MVETKTIIAVIIVGFFLMMQFSENIWPYIGPRSICKSGTHLDPDNPKLCIPDTNEEPRYFPVMKESIFMLLVFISLTYIFSRKK